MPLPPTPQSSSSTGSASVTLSPVGLAANQPWGVVTSFAGTASQTSGTTFYLTQAGTCLGGQFYWAPNTTRTVRVSLWDFHTRTRLAFIDVSVSGTGTYSGTFASSVALNAYQTYTVSFFEMSGTDYSYFNSNTSSSPVMGPLAPRPGGPGFEWGTWANWSGSDVFPASVAGTERYPVGPVLG